MFQDLFRTHISLSNFLFLFHLIGPDYDFFDKKVQEEEMVEFTFWNDIRVEVQSMGSFKISCETLKILRKIRPISYQSRNMNDKSSQKSWFKILIKEKGEMI